MKLIRSKDLWSIFLLTTIFLILITVPGLDFNKYILEVVFFILLFLFSGYSLISLLRPEESYKSLTKKPVLIFVLSILLSIFITLLLKFSLLGFHLRFLIIGLSILTMFFSLTAYIRRINYFNSMKNVKHIEPPISTKSLEDFDRQQDDGKFYHMDHTLSIDLKIPKKGKTSPKYQSYDLLFTMAFSAICLIFLLILSLNQISIGETLGTLLIIFLPGYTLTAALYPRKQEINFTERIGLSLMISLLTTLLLGIILNYFGFSDILRSIITFSAILTIIATTLAYARRLKISSNERFDLELTESWKNLKESLWNKGSGKLSVILIFLLLASVVATIYLIAYPNPGESFTEFYLLGPNGKAADYPTNLTAGETGNVTIGIVNHEHQNTSYKIVITSNGKELNEINITLNNEEKQEIPYNFTVSDTSTKKIEFLVYKLPDENNVYLSTRLWVNLK